jgi:hypothetical protein
MPALANFAIISSATTVSGHDRFPSDVQLDSSLFSFF